MAIREIEFRGKRIESPIKIKHYASDGWVYGGLIECDDGSFILPYDISGEMYIDRPYKFRANDVEARVMLAKVDTESIGQSTGLVDNNERKIFDGDIVELYCIRTYCGRQVSQYDKPTKFRAVVKFGQCWNRYGIGFVFDYNNKYNEKVCEPIGKEQESRDIWKRAIGEFVPNEYKKETHPNWVWKNYLVVIGNVVDNPELLEG